jgi:phage terminase small subunit
MTATGRRPYDTSDSPVFGVPSARLRPPTWLPGPLREAFVELVASVPASQFQASDTPLIVRWLELQGMIEDAAAQIRAEGMVTTDGKVAPWVRIHLDCTKALSGLALRLKLSPQARSPKAPKTKPGTMSYYDQQRLMEADNASEEDTLPPTQ